VLNQVVLEWRENRVELPNDAPWYWSAAELESFIAQRKDEW